MRKIINTLMLFFAFLMLSQTTAKAQYVRVYYDDYFILRIVSTPGYLFQTVYPKGNTFEIKNIDFYNFIKDKINSLEIDNTYKGYIHTQIQVVIMDKSGRYDILNLVHNYCKIKPNPYVSMELNGKQVTFDLELQLVIDKLVNHHINNKGNNIDEAVIDSILANPKEYKYYDIFEKLIPKPRE